ncbi:membrane protein [Pseudacidovorax intermedius]|uniref:Membrane protein n=1 Tax=Pseudacidovorax intermedius TaxID=433924 RepID=A0A147H586_9BURK|nr:HdeD family acid-resistance protein [Pseudacidovorax intermedius]KTT25123.1 membrane protein [Pseudacidovorax intermedius]
MQAFAPHWGWLALRGVAAVLFGVLALALPGLTVAVMVLLWGAYALVDGVFALMAGFKMRHEGRPLWAVVLLGLLGVAAGIVALVWPGMTALTLVMVIGAWAVVGGVFQIATAIRLRREIEGEWAYVLSGALSVLFGLALLVAPGAGAVAMAWLIGGFALAYGVLMLVLAFRVRKAR